MDDYKERIYEHYIKGQGSIQDIARIYRVSVEEVLDIVGEGEMKSVDTTGDLIDAQEAGPGAEMSYGKTFNVPFSTD